MIRVTVHRKFADGSPSLSVSPRRGFKTFENAANAAMRLLAGETRQPGHERVAEYVVTYRWDTGRVQRDYYRATSGEPPEYLRSEVVEDEPGRAMGRCRDCGAAVEVETRMHEPARVLPHGCPARVCEYPGCRVTELHDRMVQADDGAWFCPRHGLLNVAKVLLTLYRAPGDADWSQICELIAETLPGVIAKAEAAEGGSAPP
jgi:hypothetical protein